MVRPLLARLTAAALLALTACAHGGSSPRAHDTLRLALATEPHSLDPLLAQSIPENEVLRLIDDPLIACDAAGRPVPALAAVVPTRANGGISGDGKTVTYRLRRGVRWHDGVPFTSADVAASFRAVMDPRNPIATRHGYDDVVRVETPDPYTVRFRLARPFAPFTGTVFAESDAPYYVAPAHLIRGAELVHAPLAAHPVGTGPYRVVRWLHGDRLELAANDRYWGGKPSIPHVVIRFIPDENAQLVGLRSGELDGALGLSTNAAATARTIPHLRVVQTPLNGYYGVLFNTAKGALRDVRVRRAIAETIDAKRFIADVTHGAYAPAIADLPRSMWAADPSLSPVPYDPQQAAALMAQAGYGPERRLSLELAMLSSSQTHRVEAVALQAQLRPLGVDLRIHPYVGSIYSAPLAEHGILASGRYDLAMYGWYAGMDPDDSSQFLCDQRPPDGYDVTFLCSPEMDAAQRAALGTYDDAARTRAYARIERLLLRDLPIAYLASPVATAALRDDVAGYQPSLVTGTENAQRWRFVR